MSVFFCSLAAVWELAESHYVIFIVPLRTGCPWEKGPRLHFYRGIWGPFVWNL